MRFGIQSQIGKPLRATLVTEGGGSIERSTGIKVISMISVLMIPIPVKIPNERMVGILKVNSEKNPAAAIPPANIITGPTRTIDCTTASLFAALGSIPSAVSRSKSS
ncbi:hypothetical protein D3C81_863580 [compost metagenome]